MLAGGCAVPLEHVWLKSRLTVLNGMPLPFDRSSPRIASRDHGGYSVLPALAESSLLDS